MYRISWPRLFEMDHEMLTSNTRLVTLAPLSTTTTEEPLSKALYPQLLLELHSANSRRLVALNRVAAVTTG